LAEYQLLLDDGRSADFMAVTIEAGDDEEAMLLGRIHLSATSEIQRIVILRWSLQIAALERSH